MEQPCSVCATAAELRERTRADSRHVTAMGVLLVLLFLFAIPGLGAWPAALAFLLVSGLAAAMIVKSALSRPIQVIFLGILACILLLQGATRVANNDTCETNGRQTRPPPGFGAAARGLNPFEYPGCFDWEGFSSD